MKAGQLWSAVLFPTADYPMAKPLSMFAGAAHPYPWFAQGGE